MKKYISLIVTVVVLMIGGSSCRQHDYHTLVVKVPEMRNQACVDAISKSLGGSPGITRESVKFDIPNRQIIVTYDSLMTADKNIEFLVAKAGFKANDIPADKNAKAALPQECRR